MGNEIFLLTAFLVLAAGLLFFRKSIAIICWLVSGQFDLGAGAIGGGLTKLAYLNGVKILGFPAWLSLRLRKDLWRQLRFNKPSLLWLVFVFYAMVTLLWTPNQFLLTGLKQTGYLIAYTLGYLVLYAGWRNGDLTHKSVITTILIASAIAILQTYVMGNTHGRTLEYARYVSFTSKQQFGEFLFATIVFLLFIPRINHVLRFVLIMCLYVQLFLNGSRSGLLGGLFALFVFLVARKGAKGVLMAFLLISISSAAYLAKDDLLSLATRLTAGNRLSELVSSVKGGGGLEQVGTAKARMQFWAGTIDYMRRWSFMYNMLGKGMSSSGMLIHDKAYNQLTGTVVTTDPNRVLHNEFLRVAFEYGIIGLLMFLAFLLSVVLSVMRPETPMHAKLMFMAFMPGFIVFLLVENIFSGSGSAGGIGFLLVLSYVLSSKSEKIR